MNDFVPLQGLATRLLVHARASEAAAVAELASTEAIGAVFVGTNESSARQAVAAMRMKNDAAPVMLDANRYSGRNRCGAGQGVSSDWMAFQRRFGLPWQLSDSGYIGDGDLDGLRTILTGTRSAGDGAVAVLPLAPSWWTVGRVEQLIAEVQTYQVPVALVLEHSKDPFSAFRTVVGVMNLIRAVPVPVLLLRSDTSGLGVLANGGAAAAVGSASGLRHLYPVPKKGGGGPLTHTSLLWPVGLSYRTIEKLTDAIAADPDALHWVCMCSVCYGRSIEWILNFPNTHTNAFLHSVAALRSIATDIEAGRETWQSMCMNAQWKTFEVAELSGKSWQPPAALGAWNRALQTPVG